MKTVRKRSQKQEKEVAKTFNAKTTVASGAFWQSKGDVRSDKFLVECKTTLKDYYTITAKLWEKIREEAIKDHMRTPLLIVDLQDKYRYVIFSPKDFETPLAGVEYMRQNNITSSFRLLLGYSALIEGCPLLFNLKGNRLAVMGEKPFLEIYKEEIFNDKSKL